MAGMMHACASICVYVCVCVCVCTCVYVSVRMRKKIHVRTYSSCVKYVNGGESGGCVCVYYTYVRTVHVTSNLQVSADLLRRESANGCAAGC